MRKIFICIFLLGLNDVFAQAAFEERVTGAANIATTVNNLGMIGNAFRGSYNVLGFPSCQFPARSGVEHLFQGGLWVGGIVAGQTAVSTGAFDAAAGYVTGGSNFEFTAAPGTGLKERSALFNSPLYTPAAISHQDFVSDFTDKNVIVPGTSLQISQHLNPLGVDIHFESYNWNFAFANFFVILNFKITNNGSRDIDSLHLGYWADGVIRNINKTAPGGTPFFNKGGNGFVDSLLLGYEYDATGDVGFTDSYFSMKFLGAEKDNLFFHPKTKQNFACHYNTWLFGSSDPKYFPPPNDAEKFSRMSQGLDKRADWPAIQNEIMMPGNRSNLITAGSFGTLKKGESIEIAFALVCAKKVPDGLPNSANTAAQRLNLNKNAQWAQTAYNGEDLNFNGILDAGEDRDANKRITRFILPSPPDIPHTKIIARSGAMDIYWADNAEKSVDPISKKQDFEGYRIYLSTLGFDVENTIDVLAALKQRAAYDKPANRLFFDTGLDEIKLATPARFENDTNIYRYKYTIDKLANGWQYAISLTAFDQGDLINNLESLETAPLSNLFRTFPGKPANGSIQANAPFAYPNPYYAGASWEGNSTRPEDRKLIFAGLPARARIRVMSSSGDLIDEFEHQSEWKGQGASWFNTYSDPSKTVMPGGEHAWDLLSKHSQIISRGLYLFVVEDMETGKVNTGRFSVIK